MKQKYLIGLTIAIMVFPVILNAQDSNDERAEFLYSTACDAVLSGDLEYALECLYEGKPLALASF